MFCEPLIRCSIPTRVARAAWTLALWAAPAGLGAQQAMTLDDAVGLARANSPAFLTVENDLDVAGWAVREAYAGFLPSLTVRSGAQYVAAGTQRFGIFTGDDIGVGTTDYYLSDYSLNLSYTLSGRTFFQTSRSRAERRAAEAGIDAAAFTLTTDVTRQYLLALRAQEAVKVAERQVERAAEIFELADARVRVGAAVATEGKQAEVEQGRAEVALLEAVNLLATERLRLMEQIGAEFGEDVELTEPFELFDIQYDRQELVRQAMGAHPELRSLRATGSARVAASREVRSDFFPSLSVSVDWSGFTRQIGDTDFLLGQARGSVDAQRNQCLLMNEISAGLNQPLTGFPSDCSGIILTPADEQRLLSGNRAFPFDFERQPVSAVVRVSLPIFTGFSRKRQAEAADAAAEDAQFAVRAEELRLRTEVAERLGDAQTTYRIAAIEERNREVAGEQLALARERYRLGAAPFLDLLEAESSMAEAERDYLNAVYDFHDALSALESAVGRRLRPNGGGE